jgi:hypothetical protein
MSESIDWSIDWKAADQVAARCGARTRALTSDRDLDELRPWALRMSREHSGPAAATYYELAVLVGAAKPLPEPDPLETYRSPDDEWPQYDDDEDETEAPT